MALETYLPVPTAVLTDPLFGLPLLPLLNGAWTADPPDGYTGANSYMLKALKVTGTKRLWQQDLFDSQNAINLFFRRVQYLLHIMNQARNGLTDVYYAELGNCTEEATWPIVSVTTDTITLQTIAGDNPSCDPSRMLFQVFSINPDWPLEPGASRMLITPNYIKLPPGGLFTINSPSMLAGHGGWHVERVNIPEGFALGDTFSLTVSSDVGRILTPYPATDLTPISGRYRFYVHTSVEPWSYIPDVRPLWCEKHTLQTSDFASEHVILYNRIRFWKAAPGTVPDSTWFKAEEYKGDVFVKDWTAKVIAPGNPLIRVYHGEVLGYETRVDLSSLKSSLTGDRMVFTCWSEAISPAGEYVGCNNRCAHSKPDYSGSYGDLDYPDLDGVKWFCDLGTAATGFANYKPQCYQPGVCTAFEEEVPGNPVDETLMKQILLTQPFIMEQLMAGFADFIEYRMMNGCPSIASLAFLNMTVPVTYSPQMRFTRRGGWSAYSAEQIDGVWDIYALQGHEQYWPLSMESLFRFGFAAWHSKRPDVEGAVLTDVCESMMISSSHSICPATGEVSGTAGRPVQRCGTDVIGMVIPSLNPALASQAFVGGVIYHASESDPITFMGVSYLWRIAFERNMNWYRRDLHTDEPLKFTVKVLDQVAGTDGFWLELENREVTCTTMATLGEDRTTRFRCGGTNVRAPDRWNLNNRDCWTSRRGPMRECFAYPGDVICTEAGLRFWITDAVPNDPCSTGLLQSWDAEDGLKRCSVAPKRYFIPYNSTSETLAEGGLVITRSAGTVILTGQRDGPSPMAESDVPPIDHVLPIDQYWYCEGLINAGTASEKKILFIKFSNANLVWLKSPYNVFNITANTEINGAAANTYTALNGDVLTDPALFPDLDAYELALAHVHETEEWTCMYEATYQYDVVSVDRVVFSYMVGRSGVKREVEMIQLAVGVVLSGQEWNEYWVQGADGNPFTEETVDRKHLTFYFPYNVVGGDIAIYATVDSPNTNDESKVYVHKPSWPCNSITDDEWATPLRDGIPFSSSDLETYRGGGWGKRGDRIFIRDENGYLASQPEGSLKGTTIEIRGDGTAYPEKPQIYMGVAGSEVQIDPADLVCMGAHGFVYGKTALTAGQQMTLFSRHADRNGMIRAAELESIRAAIAGLMGGGA